MTSSTWKVRHGDTSYSDVWAVLDENGAALDLTGWQVLAQAREDVRSDRIMCEFTREHGVTVGTAQVKLPSGRKVITSTIRLYLSPTDFEYLPREWSGVFDVEITELDNDDLPVQRFTVVDDGHLHITPDVSR